MDDFEKWWLYFTKLEPDGWDVNAMAAAGGAWAYQQKNIDALEQRLAALRDGITKYIERGHTDECLYFVGNCDCGLDILAALLQEGEK